MPKLAILILVMGMSLQSAFAAESPRLGKNPNPDLLKSWNASIPPDGSGLPPGSGSVREGATIYQTKCIMCHGPAGAGKPADQLTGGIGTLASAHPVKTVASFWPYATTLFDYIRRAMPLSSPRSLEPNEVYALCAYVLSIDGIVPSNAVLDARSLSKIKMPNRNGFQPLWNSAGAPVQ
ncbi:MAG: cytochrome c [Betaproteobacteria bacterium]